MKTILIFLFAFLSFTAVFSQPVFDWVRSYHVGFPTESKFIGVDAAKNVYVVLNFKNSVDLDPGPGVFTVTAATNKENVCISKLDAAGNFVWGKQIGYDHNVICNSSFVDLNGNIYLSGSFGATVDFDPGTAVYNLTNTGASSFITKLDMNGDFQWANKIDGSGSMYQKFITGDHFGNIYLTGNYGGTFDFDPGTAVYNISSTGSENVFILKLNAAGNFRFAKVFFGSYLSYAEYIKTDIAGNVYTSGYFEGVVDFDPGVAVFNLTGTGSHTYFLSKLDSTGNFTWAKKDMSSSYGFEFGVEPDQSIIGYTSFTIAKYDINGNLLWSKPFGTNYLWPSGLQNILIVDDNGSVYITGRFAFTEDFDPGPGVYSMSPLGSNAFNDVFLCKINPDGDLLWAKSYGGYADDFAVWMAIDGAGDIYTLGSFQNNVDFDPDPPVFTVSSGGGTSLFVHKMAACPAITTSGLSQTVCNSYTLNGTVYNNSGTYTQVLTNAGGCDSIITLTLIVSGSTTDLTANACDSYNWQGQLLINSGNYSDTLTSSTGCDSILNLALVINNSSVSNITVAICEGQDYDGHTTTGNYTDIFTSSTGCDSTRTLHLTVKPKKYNNINQSICEGEGYAGYTATGTYVDHFTSTNGCDSIRTLNLTVNPVERKEIEKNICEGESYAGYNTSGIYYDTLFTSNGCDSIIRLQLKVEKKQLVDLGPDTGICNGDSIVLHTGVFQSYLWQDGSTTDHYTAKRPGIYSVSVNGTCGTSYDEIVISEKICGIFFPGAFTPNNDGVNDKFIILNAYNLAFFRLSVYDRYGEKVFETENPFAGWNGKINGNDAATGAYAWYCNFKEANVFKKMKGTVLLLR